MRGLIRLIVLLIVVAGGYWAYYVFAAADPADKFGVMINKNLPVSAREYACAKLKERFGDVTAPEGCAEFAEWAPKPAPAAEPAPATEAPAAPAATTP